MNKSRAITTLLEKSMKHISEFLIPKMRRLERERQHTLFEMPVEKGSGEWRTFNNVRQDVVDAYDVHTTKKAIVIAQENHVLRITYPPVRRLRRV